LKRWLVFVAAWQAVLVAALVAYALLLPPRGHGLTWAAPPLAGVVGTALPLQLAAARIARAALR
jgi:branched-subunit amino acid transport protein